jgi:hypothetical protein
MVNNNGRKPEDVYEVVTHLILDLAPHKEQCQESYSRLFSCGVNLWYLINETPEHLKRNKALLTLSDMENALSHMNYDLFTTTDNATQAVLDHQVHVMASLCMSMKDYAQGIRGRMR